MTKFLLLLITFSLTFISCKAVQEPTDFNLTRANALVSVMCEMEIDPLLSNDDLIEKCQLEIGCEANLDEENNFLSCDSIPLGDDEECEGDDCTDDSGDDTGSGGDDTGSGGDDNGDDTGAGGDEMIACDVDIRMTSASHGFHTEQVSSTRIVVGEEATIREEIAKLDAADMLYFSDGLDGKLSLSNKDFVATSHSESLDMAFANNSMYKVTSSHGEQYRFYSAKEFSFLTTSSKSERLKILAHDKLKVRTTSYDIHDALLMLKTSKDKIKICVRETAAGSLDIDVVGNGNTEVNIVSIGTSWKNTFVSSHVANAKEAKQFWRGTGFDNSQIEITNGAALKNHVEVGYTAFQKGSLLDIAQAGTQASVYVHGTSIGRNSEVKIQNQASQGTLVKTKMIHGTAGNLYRDNELELSGLAEILSIKGQ